MRRYWAFLLLISLMVSGCVIRKVEYNYPPEMERKNALSSISFLMPGWELSGHAARASSYDRSGHNVDAYRILPGETVTLADIEGPGVIRHIWSTTNATGPYGRTIILRMYWDGSDEPCVEVPYGDFFGVGHALEANVNSWPITVGSSGRARNCWWRMPFENGARITATNQGDQTVSAFYYYIDYLALDNAPPSDLRFHARYHQAYPADFPENYVILETRGSGAYMGCVYNVESTQPNWWGEGDDLIEVDGNPPLYGTGTEDYFNDAWGMREQNFPWHGTPICEGYDDAGLRTSMYRFHFLDTIPFQEHIKVSIEHGAENDRADNLSSVAFWYQTPMATDFPKLPSPEERLSGKERTALIRDRAWRLATSDDPSAFAKLESLLSRAQSSHNQTLIKGLQVYVEGKRNPNDAALQKMDDSLSVLEDKMQSIPRDKLYTEATIEIPTDDDNPAPGPLARTHLLLERARHDLARRVAHEHKFEPGDEIIIESRDINGTVTPPPAYKDTPDFTSSYAKVDDPFLMGRGARFTYGNADPSRARFTPDFPRAGRYEVLVIFSYGANAGDTRYVIKHADGEKTVPLPQHGRMGTPARNNKKWISLGTYRFEKGRDPEQGCVTLRASPGAAIPNDKFEYRAYADAVRFVYQGG